MYLYTNQAGSLSEFESECMALDAAGYVVNIGNAWWERTSGTGPALQRPAFQQMLRRLRAGDTILTATLASLGCNLRDVIATAQRCRSLGVRVCCVEVGDDDLTAPGSVTMRTLHAIERLERQGRSARMKLSAQEAADRGAKLGRKPLLEPAMHEEIRAAIRVGTSISELARTLRVSRQTIMRIRDGWS
jgi:putative DNA-invertase from lambdoid prophage Rac